MPISGMPRHWPRGIRRSYPLICASTAGCWRVARKLWRSGRWLWTARNWRSCSRLTQDCGTTPLRVSDAIVVLSAAEGRSELEILRQISESTWDVHTVSLFPADEPAGMIAIEDGVTAYDSLRSLIIAAAYPVFAQQRRAVQPARKPQGLTEFMRSVRVGSATAGSYVLTAHTPVPPRLSGPPRPEGSCRWSMTW